MKSKKLFLIGGISYIIIFFAAIFANFFVLEMLKQAPLETVQQSSFLVRLGVMAFLVAAMFDVVVAWVLNDLYQKHSLTKLSTYLRLSHAIIFGVGLFALIGTLNAATAAEVTTLFATFNNIWLVGLFFFGMHLILLAQIAKCPKFISVFLFLAGIMYMVDTSAHFLLANYQEYASIFLALVAIPSIFGEMAFSIWMLKQGLTLSD